MYPLTGIMRDFRAFMQNLSWRCNEVQHTGRLSKFYLWFTGAKQKGRDQKAPNTCDMGVEWERIIYIFILSTLNTSSVAEEIERTESVGRQTSEETMAVVSLEMMVLAAKMKEMIFCQVLRRMTIQVLATDLKWQKRGINQRWLWNSALRFWIHLRLNSIPLHKCRFSSWLLSSSSSQLWRIHFL